VTSTRSVPAVTAHGGGWTFTPLITVLAITQTVGYGVLSYAFSVLLTPIAADLHTSTAAVTGAYTVSIAAAAAGAIPAGRWLDRHGGRALMTSGSILGVMAVVAWSQVTAVWQLYAVFAVIGIAATASLYEAAFPVVIAATDPARRDQALLAVTIVAGFASSIFFPLTGWLLGHHSWRVTLLILAALLAVTAIPGHLAVVPNRRTHHATARRDGVPVREALRDNRFWLLAGAFVAQGAATSAVGVLLVAFLRHAGQPATVAATISGLLGVLSVTGRLATTGMARRFGMTAVTAAVFAVQAVGAATLTYTAGSLAWAAICITAFGLGFGVATIARPAILAARYGTHRYATIAAAMSLPITLAKAAAPVGAAAFGVGHFLPWTAGACLLAAGLLWAARN
jgi:predicted MFS family arabinose efflux permease